MNNRHSNETQGVKTLLGDPKKAIIKLAVPMIVAMLAHTLYNLVDALWVSGFGQEWFTDKIVNDVGVNALAAVGFVLPFFMMSYAIATGIGVGAGSALSRRIGSKDKQGADNVAIHSIILTLAISLVFTFILFFSARSLFEFIGAEKTIDMAVSYGRVIFLGSIFLFFVNVAFAILRGEGDVKRAMYAMIFGSALNIILDPIFIYVFEMGVTGAAVATVLSMAVTTIILMYWLFFRKNTYVSFHFKDFKLSKKITFDIFKVGLPASVQQLSMSFMMLVLQIIILKIAGGGEEGIAVYNAGWRIVMIAILPLLGLATAVVSVTGAAYGAKTFEKINTSLLYSIKIGLIIEIVIASFIFIFAPQISSLFTTTAEGALIQNDLVMFLKITCLFYPAAAFGIVSSSMFQGTGKGLYSLIATLLRTIFLAIPCAFIFTYFLDLGLIGVWWALVVANLTGSLISFSWGKIYVNNLLKKPSSQDSIDN